LDTAQCPGDPLWGHGGEATGGPDGSETWCFEGDPADSCGTNPPWDVSCFDHLDMKALPSPNGTNYWHLDTYRADQRAYCGNYCVWCGSDSIWDGIPVECGTWANTPGYGDQWNCIAQLDLDSSFTVTVGCTLYFDPRYDTECKYDYFYVEFWSGDQWQILATFNATSNNPGPECLPGEGSPDWWANTDLGQPTSCDWQERSNPAEPAFALVLEEWGDSTLLDSVTCAPSFRWRFESDRSVSDQDGDLDTDGGAFIDNVWVFGDPGSAYAEDFEHGSWAVLESRGWSKPDPAGVIDQWHLVHDPDGPYEGGDGGDRNDCRLDSSWVWRARPEMGFPADAAWRNGWFYRLVTPKVHIENSGCVVQYDRFMCSYEYCCQFTDTQVRFYDSAYGEWCPWTNIDGELLRGGCFFWEHDHQEDLTVFYSGTADSMQFAWDFLDLSGPCDFCRRIPKGTDLQIDNVSIGFYDGDATVFSARPQDLLHDTFHDSICGHNSFFDEYDPVVLATYAGPPYTPELPWDKQFVLDVFDKDGVAGAALFGSVDGGTSWTSKTMTMAIPHNPGNPGLGGTYYATLCPNDFGLPRWERATEVWYYVEATDQIANVGYFPAAANPLSPSHTGSAEDYLTFSIFPMFPADYMGWNILLVDGYQQTTYDWTQCLSTSSTKEELGQIYEQTLVGAGYCYDKFDILGVGVNPHIQPIQYSDYDAVVWAAGPHCERHLFDKEAQEAIRDYLEQGGKVVLCGDRIAMNMSELGVGQDSLGGEFLAGIMGCEYLSEAEVPFDKPYLYLEAADTVYVFGVPQRIRGYPLDSLVVYRECPEQKDMSYVLTNLSPPAGYTAQPLLHVLNPDAQYDPADAAIYVEKPSDAGQCVFVDFDLCALVNYGAQYCSGITSTGLPNFAPGYYCGRVELMRTILEDLFGIPSNGPGNGGRAEVPERLAYGWQLDQVSPNPFVSGAEMRFEVARAGHVSIKIYDTAGRLVRTLRDMPMEPGRHSVKWDGTNATGLRVSGGVYFCKMEAGSFSATKKLLLVK
jgi:hypothetical protein